MDYTFALADHCCQKFGWTQDQSHRMVNELFRFLYDIKAACNDYDSNLYLPSPLVDQVWHEAILFTEMYRDLCHKITKGQFINHDPVYEDQGLNCREPRYQSTLMAFRDAGHSLDSAIWPNCLTVSNGSLQKHDSVMSVDFIQLYIKLPTGRTITLRCPPDAPVDKLKQQIQDKQETLSHEHLLYFGGARLKENQTLQDAGISNDSTLHLV
jgi:Ubiquitin family